MNGSRSGQSGDRGTEILVILCKLRFNDAIASKLMPTELLKGKYAGVFFAVLFLYRPIPIAAQILSMILGLMR